MYDSLPCSLLYSTKILSLFPCKLFVYIHLESTEQTVDQTYQVLKQAGEISSKATDTMKTTTTANINDVSGGVGNNGATTAILVPSNLTMKDIPVVNVPDYPDRVVAPRRGPLKPSSSNMGPNLQPIKQGLTAPVQDVSSSGPTLKSNIKNESIQTNFVASQFSIFFLS